MNNFTPLSKKLLSTIQPKQKDHPNLKAGNTENVGRPTKYHDGLIDEVDIYITKALAAKNMLPSIEGFAVHLKVDEDTIKNWANARVKDAEGKLTKERLNPRFFGAIKRLKSLQKEKLVNDGMYGGKNVNPTMAIFLLKVNHGMVETAHVDHTTKGQPLPFNVVSYKDTHG